MSSHLPVFSIIFLIEILTKNAEDQKSSTCKRISFCSKCICLRNNFRSNWILDSYYFYKLLSNACCADRFILYVLVYTPIKHRSVYATLIGSISGAVPPVVGYTAVANNLDLGVLILFLILVFWQMPHFYSIAIFRIKGVFASKHSRPHSKEWN